MALSLYNLAKKIKNKDECNNSDHIRSKHICSHSPSMDCDATKDRPNESFQSVDRPDHRMGNPSNSTVGLPSDGHC